MAEEFDDLKKGRLCLVLSMLSLSEVVLNGIVGIFPGGFIGQGGIGQKFYLLPWLSQKFGNWNGQEFWTDSGFLSEQEYAFIVLHIFLMYIGFAYLRRANDPEKDLRIDPDDWSWLKEHPNTLTIFIPTVIMWLFVLAVISIWVFLTLAIVTFLIVVVKLEPAGDRIQIVRSEEKTSVIPSTTAASESTQTISDSVAGGDVVGGDKVVNDPDTIAKVAIEAYRRGISESKD